jgi:hypothetical protein
MGRNTGNKTAMWPAEVAGQIAFRFLARNCTIHHGQQEISEKEQNKPEQPKPDRPIRKVTPLSFSQDPEPPRRPGRSPSALAWRCKSFDVKTPLSGNRFWGAGPYPAI